MIHKKWLLILLLALIFTTTSCSSMQQLSISIDRVNGSNVFKVKLLNSSGSDINFIESTLNHPLDMWNMSFSNKGFEKEVLALAAFVVDEKGARHLICGFKDAAPTDIVEKYITLKNGDFIDLPPINIGLYSSCIRGNKNNLSIQIAYIKTSASDKVNLADEKSYSVIYYSNIAPVNSRNQSNRWSQSH